MSSPVEAASGGDVRPMTEESQEADLETSKGQEKNLLFLKDIKDLLLRRISFALMQTALLQAAELGVI